MTTRVCRRCGEDEVRREHRPPWMKTLAYVVPVRPQICAGCDARSWTPLQPGDGIMPWLSSAAVWLVVVSVAWLVVQAPAASETRTPAATAGPEAAEAVEPTPLPTLLPSLAPATEPAAEPATEATAEVTSTAMPTAAPTAVPKPTSTPQAEPAKTAAGTIRLRRMDVSVRGDVIEVVIDSDADDLRYTLSRSSSANGHVLDLPGKWILPRGMKMTRNFDTTNVAQLRMGLHDDYFRVVFSLRDGKAGPPTVERQGGRLRIVAK